MVVVLHDSIFFEVFRSEFKLDCCRYEVNFAGLVAKI
jgi:hypothetical protein